MMIYVKKIFLIQNYGKWNYLSASIKTLCENVLGWCYSIGMAFTLFRSILILVIASVKKKRSWRKDPWRLYTFYFE